MDDIAPVVWAKSRRDESKHLTGWLPLAQHLDDTAAVAAKLWDAWLPLATRRHIAVPFGNDEAEARRLAVFLAGIHDVGKATPAFAVQVDDLADRMRAAGLRMPASIPNDERRHLRHELAGHVLLESWLTGMHGWSRQAAQQLCVVVGGHHGVPADHGQLNRARTLHRLRGDDADGPWTDVQRHLIDRAARREGVLERLPAWRDLRLPQTAQVLLTGIVIVADWIASNDDLFPLAPIDDERPTFDDGDRVGRAWDRLQLPEPWLAAPPADTAAELLRTRFGLPPDAEIRPVQTAAFEVATAMDAPGIMVIEAPMGAGKTEAALLAVEVLAARTGAAGCFVALPTQATTDAMFLRVLDWLTRLPDVRLADEAAVAGRAARAVTLAHGRAMLNATFRELRMQGGPSDVAADDDTATLDVVAHSWMSGRKKGPLADVVVGTIDQLLFSGLRARHLALRHLGLAGKVVVIDEVHAYDAYMSVYLEGVLEWLGAYGVPVVLLSATLPDTSRRALLDAYWRGAQSSVPRDGGPTGRRQRAWATDDGATVAPSAGLVYPAITARTSGETVTTGMDAPGPTTAVVIETAEDDIAALTRLLEDALADGGCALVVRNTVGRAQETAAQLRMTFGDDVTLAHSRFLAHDRIAKDTWLRRCFGPPGADGRTARRPERAVVVATQVVEQSLDVDFDLLVTDLAPVDLMLQRIGRMHRHARSDRPPRLRSPRCVVVGVEDWSAGPPRPVSGSVRVYLAYLLYRAVALVNEIVGSDGVIRLPVDIAPLVQRAYGDGVLGSPGWQEQMSTARQAFDEHVARQRSEAGTFRLDPPGAAGEPVVGWLHGHAGEAADDSPRGQAQVRDSVDSFEVIALQSADGQLRIPDWVEDHGGTLIPLNEPPSDRLARVVAGCALRLPAYLTRGGAGDQLIKALEANYHPQLQASRLLAGQLILELDDDGRAVYGRWTFSYDARDGLRVSDDD